jgi:hypothetical protein
MPDAAYAAFIEDCRRERASLIGLIEAMENKMLGAGLPITIPEPMNAPTQALVTSMQRTLADLEVLISQYEADTASKEQG